MFDNRTNKERARDAREQALSKSQRVDRLRVIIARAEAAGINRPDLYDLLKIEMAR